MRFKRLLLAGISAALFFMGCASAPRAGGARMERQCKALKSSLHRCLPENDSVDRLTELARCESGCRPDAHSPAGYSGAFQFSKVTWTSLCYPIFERGGYGRCRTVGSMTDLCCASMCASEMIAAGGIGHWPKCGKEY